jgi:hypothetical protein
MMKIRSSTHVDRVRQPSQEASHSANKVAERAPGGILTDLAGGESENETINQDSASQPPWHVDGVQPFFDPGHLIPALVT